MLHTYLNHIHDMLHRIEQQEANAISLAATKTAEAIMNGELFICSAADILIF